MPEKRIILLFVKGPVRGLVKSRLAAGLGQDSALELYRNFVLDTLETVRKTGCEFRIFFHPARTRHTVTALLGPEYQYIAQEGTDLGQRMEHAFRRAFSDGWRRAVLVGSDIPDLTADVILEAFESLKANDVVVGPAEDGGYYLIGFNDSTFAPRIFSGIEWSTDRVFPETIERLKSRPVRIHFAPRWRDVDTMDDLRALYARNKDNAFRKSRTMAYLVREMIFKEP